MTNPPEKIALIPSDGWSWTTWPISRQEDAIGYTRTGLHLALVAAAYEAAARAQVKAFSRGVNPEKHSDHIRALTPADAVAELERMKREAWQQGYETGTGEIAGALDEAAAAKRMYLKSRNEALREAADIAERWGDPDIQIEILALMEDTGDE